MKKYYFLLAILLGTYFAKAQEQHTLQGIILMDSIPVANAHIFNMKTSLGTISDDNGEFEISGNLDDTILISHLNYELKRIPITATHLKEKLLIIYVKEKATLLEEVTITNRKKSSIELDTDIAYPIVNAKTLKLPYAGTKIKRTKGLLKIRSGFSFSLDHLISRLNGRYKREQFAQKLATQDVQLEKIRKFLTDDFFITDLHIKKPYINQFLNYCISQNIIHHYNSENTLELVQILLRESKTFPHQQEKDSTLFTKR